MIEKVLKLIAERIMDIEEITEIVKNGQEFEDFVFEEFKKLKTGSPDLHIRSVEHNGAHSFPDLKVIFENGNAYGVEVKFSASGNWKSKGNSVFESLSNKKQDDKAYKEIYVLFGRKPKPKEGLTNYQVKFAPYGSSIDRIEVTHSPRFAINMERSAHNSSDLFGESETYADFRVKTNEEKNELLRKYFNQLTKDRPADKWYLPKFSNEQEVSVEPILFSSLNSSEQKRIIAESFILYPDDLFGIQANYSNIAANMISNHFVYAPSLRDCFSSGGKIIIHEEHIEYPKILKIFCDHMNTIKELLRNPPYENFEENCYFSWEKSFNKYPGIIFNKANDLESSYELIIKHFKPIMEIRNTDTEIKESIDLSKFYSLEILN
ncbi:hypothetical protein ACKA0G_01465 (plasmid) [Priestia megaterium]|uniref:hypothetical protein n=1 Tax=Priestia megaterium TaxID=1404 RepID=UPI0038A01863